MRSTLRERLDPRLHLAAAIGWAVFVLVSLAALAAAGLAAEESERRARVDAEATLVQFATQIRDALSVKLETRKSIVEATAAQIVASSDWGSGAVRRHLEAVQSQFPEFVWLGVADAEGRVVGASGGQLRGANMSATRWFQHGMQRPFMGDVKTAASLENVLQGARGDAPLRVVDAAAPLVSATGQSVGVLGAYLSWPWIERLQSEILRALDTNRQLEVLMASEDGTLIVAPAAWLGRKLAEYADPTDADTYVVGTHAVNVPDDSSLTLTVVVRQRTAAALAPARQTRDAVFLVVLIAGLLSAAAAALVTRVLMRRLRALADEAEAVRHGAQRTLTAPAGRDEVSRIGATLAYVVEHLQQEKEALRSLNSELDARVAERTARVERLANEARHAAVTRERLRLARDLHDTLAHSLMALLTQIRLVRKLRTRLDASELDAELGRAEDVAASGLTEARRAITQMRSSRVTDSGLGPALQDLVSRLAERTGIAVSLEVDPQAAEACVDACAETVFRIAEQALRNVEQHARARGLEVTVGLTASSTAGAAADRAAGAVRIRMAISDDGVGFDPALPRPGHYGLRGMLEQATLIEAQLEIRSKPGQGSRIVLDFDA